MKFEKVRVSGFEGAFRGLRNPLESWHKSDSKFGIARTDYCDYDYEVADAYIAENEKYDFDKEYDKYYEASERYSQWLIKNGVLQNNWSQDIVEYAFIGPKDLDLAHRMIIAGSPDRKFLRQINVSVDITAPLYWYKEFDTYKIGTVANSTSTMHKLASTPITLDCFEIDDYDHYLKINDTQLNSIWKRTVDDLENLRKTYLATKDKRFWKELIRLLPESWLQTRTVTMNYEVLRNQYFQRQHHKLTEWHQYCEWIETLPYARDLIIYTKDDYMKHA